jgi:alkylation response protein AidB-like acyl-CoA dehydrogenase
MAAHGWIGMTWPEEFGGGGRPPIDRLIVGEEMIAAGAPIAAMWFADRQMGPTLIAYGTPRPAGRSCPASCPARPRGASA